MITYANIIRYKGLAAIMPVKFFGQFNVVNVKGKEMDLKEIRTPTSFRCKTNI